METIDDFKELLLLILLAKVPEQLFLAKLMALTNKLVRQFFSPKNGAFEQISAKFLLRSLVPIQLKVVCSAATASACSRGVLSSGVSDCGAR